MAGTAIRKLADDASSTSDVVLGGGIFRNRLPPFFASHRGRRARRSRRAARIERAEAPPVLGAACSGSTSWARPARERRRPRRLDPRSLDPHTHARRRSNMAEIVLDGITKVFGNEVVAVDDVSPRDRRRRVHGPRRPLRMRQVHDPADARRSGGSHRRRGLIDERQVTDLAPEAPRHRDGVPELRAVSAHDASSRTSGSGSSSATRRRTNARAACTTPPNPRPRRAAATQPGRALRRAAAACRDRARDGPRAEGVPDGRAAVEPGRQAPRADAGGAPAAARTPANDHGLRHPRSGGGDDARQPGRGAARRGAPAGRHPAQPLPATRRTSSSPRSSARRR